MSDMSFGRVITRSAARDPDRVVLRDPAGALTAGELDRRSNQLARVLLARGVDTDDLVTVRLPSDIALVVLCAAIWKAGAVPQVLDPELDAGELAAIVEVGEPALVVGVDGVDGVARAELDAAADDQPDGELPDRWAAAWKAPVSGGSTGPPKIILSGAPARVDPDRPSASYLPQEAVQLVAAPLHHSAPFLFAMRGLLGGHELVLLPQFDPVDALAAIERHRVTWTLLTPSLMARIWHLGDARADHDLASLDAVLHVGAPCAPWLKRAWLDWLGPSRVHEIYAGTESTGVTYIAGDDWLAHPGSVGRAAAGSTVAVLGPDGRPVLPGTIGTVHLRPRGGPGSTYRYLGAPAAERIDGYESLGDLGWLDADGYLYLADRSSDVVETRAGPVYPAQVEAVLGSHPAVRSCAAFGVDGRVRAVVDTAGAGVVEAELLDLAGRQLPAHAVPEAIEIVAEPVRDAAGKVRRKGLADRPTPRSSSLR